MDDEGTRDEGTRDEGTREEEKHKDTGGEEESAPQRVYTFGARAPTEGADELRSQLRLAHEYYNKHIEIERGRRDAYRRCCRDQGGALSDAVFIVEAYQGLLADEREKAAHEKMLARSRRGVSEETSENVSGLVREIRDHRAEQRRLANAERKASPAFAAKVDAGGKAAKDDAVHARHEWIRRGLFWGTYLLTDRATKQAKKARRPPKFRRWDGSGLIGVQLQRQQRKGKLCGSTVMDAFQPNTNFRIIAEPKCIYCGLDHPAVIAGGGYCCPNPLCPGPSANDFRLSLKSYRKVNDDVDDTRHTVDLKEWVEKARTAARGGGDAAVIAAVEETIIRLKDTAPACYPIEKTLHAEAWLRVERMRCGSDPVGVRLPIFMHRLPPPAAWLKWVAIVVRRAASHLDYEVQLTVEESHATMPVDVRNVVGIDVGWRWLDQLRVAYWYAGPGRGESGALTLPNRISEAINKSESLRSIRDHDMEEVKALLQDWLRGVKQMPQWLHEAVKGLAASRSPGKLAGIVLRWRANRQCTKCNAYVTGGYPPHGKNRKNGKNGKKVQTGEEKHLERVHGISCCNGEVEKYFKDISPQDGGRFDGDEDIFPVLEAWRKQDKHLLEWEYNNRRKALAYREQLFRNWAAGFARKYSLVVIEDFDLRNIARKPKPEEKGEYDDLSRSQRIVASPSAFRGALARACGSRGKLVAKVPTCKDRIRCHVCGAECEWNRAKFLSNQCEACGAKWDQDLNQAVNIRADGIAMYERGEVKKEKRQPGGWRSPKVQKARAETLRKKREAAAAAAAATEAATEGASAPEAVPEAVSAAGSEETR